MSVAGVESVGFTPYVAPQAQATTGLGSTGSATSTSGVSSAQGSDFGNLVLDGLDRLEGVQRQSDSLAVQAATGDLQAIHDYTIAATRAQVATQVTVAIRNKAVEAFNEIMRMPV